MANVKMLQATRHAGRPYPVGAVMDVPDDLAAHWVDRGIAEETKEKAAPQPAVQPAPVAKTQGQLQEDVRRQNLRIASLHGDVAAAREMALLGMPAEAEPAFGTPPPLELTTEGAPAPEAPRPTTGESARVALTGQPAPTETVSAAPARKAPTAKQRAHQERLAANRAAKAKK